MNRTSQLGILLLFSLLSLPAARADEDAEAATEEEAATARAAPEVKSKTLAERIPSVTRRTFLKAGRLELAPALGLSLNDPFYDHIAGSATIAYHLSESFWIGVSGDGYFAVRSTVPVGNTGAAGAAKPNFNKPLYSARLELAWVPFFGKLSLLAENVFHFDTYLAVGGGALGADQSSVKFMGTIALGEHFFINDWFALRLEIRDQLFMMSRYQPDANTEQSLENFLSASLGFCFFVPPSFDRESL